MSILSSHQGKKNPREQLVTWPQTTTKGAEKCILAQSQEEEAIDFDYLQHYLSSDIF